MKKSISFSALILGSVIGMAAVLQGCSKSDASGISKSDTDSLREVITRLTAGDQSIANHLKTFDELD